MIDLQEVKKIHAVANSCAFKIIDRRMIAQRSSTVDLGQWRRNE